MSSIARFVSWVTDNAETISIIVSIFLALVPAVWAFIRYLTLKSKELQHERFKIYHGLIKELVQPDSPGQVMSMDRQMAIVFELRHFSEYFELTQRLLEGLRENWMDPRAKRLTSEIDRTLKYIEVNSSLKPASASTAVAAPPVKA